MPLGMHQAVPPHGKTLHAEVNQILLLLYRECMALVDVLTCTVVVHYVLHLVASPTVNDMTNVVCVVWFTLHDMHALFWCPSWSTCTHTHQHSSLTHSSLTHSSHALVTHTHTGHSHNYPSPLHRALHDAPGYGPSSECIHITAACSDTTQGYPWLVKSIALHLYIGVELHCYKSNIHDLTTSKSNSSPVHINYYM